MCLRGYHRSDVDPVSVTSIAHRSKGESGEEGEGKGEGNSMVGSEVDGDGEGTPFSFSLFVSVDKKYKVLEIETRAQL